MYRDHLLAAQHRKKNLDAAAIAEPVSSPVRAVYCARYARIWGSIGALATFLSMVLVAIARTAGLDDIVPASALTWLLAGGWGVGAVAYGVGYGFARARLGRTIRRATQPTGELLSDLARLERPVDAIAVAAAHRVEKVALALPLVALALLAPLTLHLFVGAVLMEVTATKFADWIGMSLLLVGHAHAALVAFAIHHATLVQGDLDRGTCRVEGAGRGFWALLWTIAAAALPGAALLFVPPVIVACTGLVFVPLMFGWAARAGVAERLVLDIHDAPPIQPL